MTDLNRIISKLQMNTPATPPSDYFCPELIYECKECGHPMAKDEHLCDLCYDEGFRWCEICHNVSRNHKAEDICGTTVYICSTCGEAYNEEV